MQNHEQTPITKRLRGLAGLLLVICGLILLLDQRLQTGWLSLLVLPLIGLSSLVEGLRTGKTFFTFLGIILFGLGLGVLISVSSFLTQMEFYVRAGFGLVAFALGWAALIPFSTYTHRKTFWWALIPGFTTAALGACLLLSSRGGLDFALYVGVGLGLALLAWGIAGRLSGLVIAGSLVIVIGPGVYTAWNQFIPGSSNGLTQTSIMLFWFCAGWLAIVPFYHLVKDRVIWWPFIPGGVFGLAALGLNIGGDPGGFFAFFGNFLSLPILLTGLYLARNLRNQRFGSGITGVALLGLGLGGLIGLGNILPLPFNVRLSTGLLVFSLAWFIILFSPMVFTHKPYWWALLPAFSSLAASITLVFTPHLFLDFVFLVCIGLGSALIIWGVMIRHIAPLIPGSLIVTIGPGLFLAWRDFTEATKTTNGLTQTGIMLIWFALGWILITALSRFLTEKFTWWPLIPGGIQAMVGYGLYLGGNSSNAVNFLRNTGSIALIIFGAYLLLMRRSIKR